MTTKERATLSYAKYEKIRNEKGMTDFSVAKETGIPPTSIYDWKNGISTPKLDKLIILSDFFGVDLSEFIPIN